MATAFAAYLGFLGVRRGSQETTTKDRLIAEEKRYDECDKARREDAEKHASAMDNLRVVIDALRADRDKERQRADMLAVELATERSRRERMQGKHP